MGSRGCVLTVCTREEGLLAGNLFYQTFSVGLTLAGHFGLKGLLEVHVSLFSLREHSTSKMVEGGVKLFLLVD